MGTRDAELLMTKITVSNIVRSHEFYTQIVGLKQVVAPELGLSALPPTLADNEKDMVEVALNFTGTLREQVFILIKRSSIRPDPAQAGLTWLAFRVPDTTDVIARAVRAGFRQFRPPLAGGAVAFIHDPDGYAVEIMQIAPFNELSRTSALSKCTA